MASASNLKTGSKKRAAAAYPRVEVKTRAQLRSWLQEHHDSSTGVWLVVTKRSAGGELAWNDLVEELLCVGWVDSLPRSLDAKQTMLLATPRRATSNWSAKNKAHVASLRRRGLMTPAGDAVVEAAKRSGTWKALDGVSALEVPDDLHEALKASPPALDFWRAFPPSAKRGILEWLLSARTPQTRLKRVGEIARLARLNQRANQWPRAK